MRCLKSILGIRWWHKVTHVETRHRAADIDTAEHILLQRQLRWIGHVMRMSSNRLPMRNYAMCRGCRVAQNYITRTTFVAFSTSLTFQNWFIANKLSMNISKRSCRTFYSDSVSNSSLVVPGQLAEKVRSCKYLGLWR